MVNKEEENVVDSSRSSFEARQEEEINLYDYWKVLVKRKKIFIGIFLVPLVIGTIVSLIMPRYYRGEADIIIPEKPVENTVNVMPAPNLVNLIADIDDTKKVKIFANNSGAIKSVLISLPKKTTDKVNIIINAKTADIMPQAFKNMFDYISNLPEIKEEIAKIQAEIDLKLKKLIEENDLKLQKLIEEIDLKLPKIIEAKKANLIFLKDMSDMIKKKKLSLMNINPADLIRKDADLAVEIMNLRKAKIDMMEKRQLTSVYINPSDLIKRDADLSLEIMNLQNVKMTTGILGPLSITKQPSNAQIIKIIIITGILSFLAGIFVVFFLEYIEKMKARENK